MSGRNEPLKLHIGKMQVSTNNYDESGNRQVLLSCNCGGGSVLLTGDRYEWGELIEIISNPTDAPPAQAYLSAYKVILSLALQEAIESSEELEDENKGDKFLSEFYYRQGRDAANALAGLRDIHPIQPPDN